MKTIHLEYVAMFREATGKSGESMPTAAGNAGALYDAVATRYQLPWDRTSIRPAVNQRIATWETPIEHGDRVLFLPPSSGG